MFDLRVATSPSWLQVVLADLDSFMIDHALCERKASAMGLSLVAKYPDRKELLGPLIEFSREELEHFHIMVRVLIERGLTLKDDKKDPYVNALRALSKTSDPDKLLLDRLLIPGVIEARGCERLRLVANALPASELKDIYTELTRAEARHHGLFFRLARIYFSEELVQARADFLLDEESKIVASLPVEARVH